MTGADLIIAAIRAALTQRIYRAVSEAQLQDQISRVLTFEGFEHQREVIAGSGRYDILVGRIVIELKVKGSANAVERQAMRYVQMPEVDAVVVVTTSQRLAASLMATGDVGQVPLGTLGGKPFHVITLRTT